MSNSNNTATGAGNNKRRILVTGGAGYIGSHTVVALQAAGFHCTIIDNLSNSTKDVIQQIAEISGVLPDFHLVDLSVRAELETFFQSQAKFDACLHFAALKSVALSVAIPLQYYRNNVSGTLHLLELLDKYHCKSLIFSSSAVVYGSPTSCPIPETAIVGQCTNPYGRTKYFIEEVLRDVVMSCPLALLDAAAAEKEEPPWRLVMLRYFNPFGAHPSGKIGEDPYGPPNNLGPYVAQVADGRREFLGVFGNDYDTADGTGVRDYIHVQDVASGHVAALTEAIFRRDFEPDPKTATTHGDNWCDVFNLGSGTGTSVLEMVNAFEQACGKTIPYKVVGRREGDIATCFADATKANRVLKWSTKLGMQDMCRDTWRFHQMLKKKK